MLADRVWERYRARSRENPNRIPGLVGWWRPDRGVTLQTTLDPSGTTPPAVTVSGALAQPLALRVEITTAGALSVPAARETTNAQTYNIAPGATTTVKIDRGGVQTITYLASDFADPTHATAPEVAAAINRQIVGAVATATSGATKVTITSNLRGVGSFVEVTGGTANAALAFNVAEVAGTGTSEFRWSVDGGASFVASTVRTGASLLLAPTGITVAFPVGTYATNNVYRAQLASWVDLSGGSSLTAAAGSPLLATPGRITFTSPRGFVYTGPQIVEPNCTVGFVAKRNTIVANYQPLGSFSPVGPHGLYIYAGDNTGTNTQWGVYYGASVNSGFQLDVPKVAIVRANAPNDVDFLTNGVASKGTTGLSTYNGGGAVGDTGGSQNMESDLFELVLYNRRLTDIECARLGRYLARRNFQ